jgi:hypothetical protein
VEYFHYYELLSITIDALHGYNYIPMTMSKELLLPSLVVVTSNNFLKIQITNQKNPKVFYINKQNMLISSKVQGGKKKKTWLTTFH